MQLVVPSEQFNAPDYAQDKKDKSPDWSAVYMYAVPHYRFCHAWDAMQISDGIAADCSKNRVMILFRCTKYSASLNLSFNVGVAARKMIRISDPLRLLERQVQMIGNPEVA